MTINETKSLLQSHHIVGSRYRPPARALLDAIAVGTPLTLRAEPTNAVDPNAIAVYLKTADIGDRAWVKLDGTLRWYDTDIMTVMSESEYHVGYIAAAIAAVLRSQGFPDTDVPGKFAISPRGTPKVEFTFISQKQEPQDA